MPWYVTVPSALAVLVAAGFAVFAAWIEWSDRRYVAAARRTEAAQRRKEIAHV